MDEIPGVAPIVPEPLRRKTCPLPTQYFTGRGPALHKLEGFFLSPIKSRRVGVLYGVGGGGKTQIGLELIQRNRSRFSDVFFVDASSKVTLENDFKAITLDISDKPTVDDGLRILQQKKEDWLLFIDNADDTTLDLRPYIDWPHGNVLITTRNQEVRAQAPDCNIWVGKLEVEEAMELLLRGVADSESLEARKAASDIVQGLGCLALAVTQARGYIAQGICTLNEYLAVFRQNHRKLLEDKTVQTTDDYKHTVYTTWTASFDRLSSNAAFLFELLCFMHHEAIPSRVFEDAWNTLEELGESGVPTTLVMFLSGFKAIDSTWDILRFRALIRETLSSSLIEFDASHSTVSLHPLVQQWGRSQSQHSQETIHSTQTLLCLATPLGESKDDYVIRISLLPHIQSSTKTNLDVHFTLLGRAGFVYRCGGLWQESCDIYKQEMLEMQKQFGADHPNTLISMSNLASVYSDLGQHQGALELNVQILALRRLMLGEEHPTTLATMNNLAMIYSVLGQHRDALKLKEQVLALRSQILGDEHPDTLISMNNLAITYKDLGQYQEALKLQERGLALERQILGEEHPDTLICMGNLALTYSYICQHQEALKLKVHVLDLRTQILGESHPDTLLSTGNLATTYSDLGQYRDALRLQEQVLVLSTRILGEEHPDTLTAMSNLASTYSHLGQNIEAATLKEKVLELRRQILGEDHPNTLLTMDNLAATYSDLGRHRDALGLQEQTLALKIHILGKGHPDTLLTMSSLATIYSDLGRHQDALELQEEVLGLSTRILGENHPATLKCVANLASTFSHLDRYQDALKLQEQVLVQRTRILGGDHPDTLLGMNGLAVTYSDLGWHQDALKLKKEVLALAKQNLGEDDPFTLTCISNLACTYLDLGQRRDALKLHEQVLELRKRILGPDHPQTVWSAGQVEDLGQTTKRWKLTSFLSSFVT